MILLICILVVLLTESIFEAKYGDNHGWKSKLLLWTIIITMEIIGRWRGTDYGAVYYFMYRFSLFDYMFSYFRYKHIWFIGTTSDWDKSIKKYVDRAYLGIKGDKILLILRIILIFVATIKLL